MTSTAPVLHSKDPLAARPRLLVVDDEPLSRTLMDAVLRTEPNYDVLTAADGREAVEAVRSMCPDLMLLDVFPGGDDGFAICKTLKSEAQTRRMPIVLVSKQASSHERARGLEAGADDFLAKPFHRVELLARVRSLLRIKTLNDQLDEVEAVIYALAHAVELREGDQSATASRNVARYAACLARELELSDDSVRLVEHAALLRDIGKVGVPDEILFKAGHLDDGETRRMQRHTILGEAIIAPLRSTAALLPMIRHHHERVDGKGYPDGLCGEQIPLGARIVAIADAFQAMTAVRSYRPAMSRAKALATLEAGAGKQWDADLVRLFVAVQRRRRDNHPSPSKRPE